MTRKNPQMKSTQFKGNSRLLNNHPKSTNTHTKTLGELKTFPLNSYVHSRHLEIWVNSSSNAFFNEQILIFFCEPFEGMWIFFKRWHSTAAKSGWYIERCYLQKMCIFIFFQMEKVQSILTTFAFYLFEYLLLFRILKLQHFLTNV